VIRPGGAAGNQAVLVHSSKRRRGSSRRIVLINATAGPGLAWVKHQIRQAMAWGEAPRFLLHDNDGVFGQFRDRERRGKKGRRYRCHLDRWLADVMGIEGIPIPYGAQCLAARRAAQPYAAQGGTQSLHLSEREKRSSRLCREPRFLQPGEAVAGSRRDTGSLSGAGDGPTIGWQAGGIARARRRAARLPPGGVAVGSGQCLGADGDGGTSSTGEAIRSLSKGALADGALHPEMQAAGHPRWGGIEQRLRCWLTASARRLG